MTKSNLEGGRRAVGPLGFFASKINQPLKNERGPAFAALNPRFPEMMTNINPGHVVKRLDDQTPDNQQVSLCRWRAVAGRVWGVCD